MHLLPPPAQRRPLAFVASLHSQLKAINHKPCTRGCSAVLARFQCCCGSEILRLSLYCFSTAHGPHLFAAARSFKFWTKWTLWGRMSSSSTSQHRHHLLRCAHTPQQGDVAGIFTVHGRSKGRSKALAEHAARPPRTRRSCGGRHTTLIEHTSDHQLVDGAP
jgi:hypothetical protein